MTILVNTRGRSRGIEDTPGFYREELLPWLGCGVASGQTRDKGLRPTGHGEDRCALCDKGCWGGWDGLPGGGGFPVGCSSLWDPWPLGGAAGRPATSSKVSAGAGLHSGHSQGQGKQSPPRCEGAGRCAHREGEGWQPVRSADPAACVEKPPWIRQRVGFRVTRSQILSERRPASAVGPAPWGQRPGEGWGTVNTGATSWVVLTGGLMRARPR